MTFKKSTLLTYSCLPGEKTILRNARFQLVTEFVQGSNITIIHYFAQKLLATFLCNSLPRIRYQENIKKSHKQKSLRNACMDNTTFKVKAPLNYQHIKNV